MTKYHIKENGEPGICTAKNKPCPRGGEHFDTLDKAQKHTEKTYSENFQENQDPVSKLSLIKASQEEIDLKKIKEIDDSFSKTNYSYEEKATIKSGTVFSQRAEATRNATHATLKNGARIKLIPYSETDYEKAENASILFNKLRKIGEVSQNEKDQLLKYAQTNFNETGLKASKYLLQNDFIGRRNPRIASRMSILADSYFIDVASNYPLGTSYEIDLKFSSDDRKTRKELKEDFKKTAEQRVKELSESKTSEEILQYAKNQLNFIENKPLKVESLQFAELYDKFFYKAAKKQAKLK